MARDPNQLKYPEAWKDSPDDLKKLPPPAGVNKAEWDAKIADGNWYANVKVYADGRQVVEWYQRGVGGGPGQPDPVQQTSEGVVPSVKEEWDKGEATAEDKSAPPGGVTTKTVNGRVFKWNAETRAYDIPSDETPTTSTGTKPQIPPGGSSETQGTPIKDADGNITGWDNSRPRQVIKDKNGTVIWSEELTGADLTAWRNNQQAGQPQTKREPDKTHPGYSVVTTVTNGQTETHYEKDDNPGVSVPAPAEAPKPVSTNTTEPFIVQAGPDGKITTTPNPNYQGEKPQRSTVKGSDGRTYVVSVDKDGKATAAPVEGLPAETPKGTPAEPAGAPRPSGRVGEAAADLQAYDQFLNAELRRPGTKLTPEQADKLRENRRNFWKTALEEQTGIVNTQAQSYRDQGSQRTATLTDLANRRTNETSIANQAAADFMPLATKLGSAPGGGAGLMRAIEQARINAADFVTLSGANRQVPEIQPGPALTAVNGLPLPGGAPATMAPGFNPRANATGAVGASVTATNAAAVNPTGANVQAANGATMAGTGAAMGALGVPPVSPPPPAPQAVIPVTPPTFLAGSSRGYAHDPTAEIQRMIADPGMDNDVIRQVVAQDYPGYPIDELLQNRAA